MENYMYEVELEQITPYVNEIEGVGKDILRPTEFKPRFDSFLWNKMGNKIFDLLLEKDKQEIEKEKEKKLRFSFNYNIVIKTEEDYKKRCATEEDYKKRCAYEFFKISENNKYRARKEGLKLKIKFFSLNSKMIKIIKESLPEFLATTNFGKRKNKCYGSFYISKNDCSSYKEIDSIKILEEYKFFKGNKNYLELEGKDVKKILANLELDREPTGKTPLVMIRVEKNRKESLGLMKILKTKEDKYRLYFIPNFELIKKEDLNSNLKTNEHIKLSKDSEDKKDIFNYKSFLSYTEKIKKEVNKK